MPEEPDADRLKALEARISAAKGKAESKAVGTDKFSGAEVAWRMVTELLAGLLIGFGIGYGLDSLFGTMPIFLILFIFAGFAAGVNVMLRTAKAIQAKQMNAPEGGHGDEGR